MDAAPQRQNLVASSQHHQTGGAGWTPNAVCATEQPLFWGTEGLAGKWGWEMG